MSGRRLDPELALIRCEWSVRVEIQAQSLCCCQIVEAQELVTNLLIGVDLAVGSFIISKMLRNTIEMSLIEGIN